MYHDESDVRRAPIEPAAPSTTWNETWNEADGDGRRLHDSSLLHLRFQARGADRAVRIYLPPSYHVEPSRRYPVLYVQDGESVLDLHGGWKGVRRLDGLAGEGCELICVAVESGGQRIYDYSPFPDEHWGGGGAAPYLAFLLRDLKPRVDEAFRTLPGRSSTAILGASMGGLLSLYAFFASDAFGAAAALSPSVSFARGGLEDYVRASPRRLGRIYVDTGTHEFEGGVDRVALSSQEYLERALASRLYLDRVRHLDGALRRRGYGEPEFRYAELPRGTHDPRSWSHRLPDAVRHLFDWSRAETARRSAGAAHRPHAGPVATNP